MKKNIPKIWKNAYMVILIWYAINYAISTISEYYIFKPYSFVLWNGLYLYEALCILVVLIFLWSDWLFQFKPIFQVVGHLFGLFANFMIMGSFSYFLDYYLDGFIYFEDWQQYMVERLSWDALRFHDQYIITVFIYYIIRYIESLQRKEHERGVLALKNKEMELSLLKSQINPHFLFNTLNSISTLINFDKDKARKMITQLSDVFRYALDSTGAHQLVGLKKELVFIDNYIKIQKVRFEERLNYEKHIEEGCMDVSIPPMVLQPLIENAVKYGIGPKDDGGTIKLIIKKIVGGIYFEIQDDGLGINAVKVHDGNSSGIGLKNSDQRLKSLYGPSSGLKINASEHGYKVSFIILNQNLNLN